jgi:hypothetical protein
MSKRKKDINEIRKIVTKNARTFAAVNRVKQTAIGYKIREGKIMRDTISAIFFVRYKPKATMLRSLNIEPLPKEIEGIPTDVIEVPTGFAKRILTLSPRATAPDDSRHRPVSGGIAMINAQPEPLGTGTLGLIVKRKGSEGLFGCTNNHVGANEDIEGRPPTANIGDPWIQPGAHGGGQASDDTIGTLDKWGRIKPAGIEPNFYDFSIGKIDEPAKPYEMIEVGAIDGNAELELGDRVLKRGRTTRKTVGEVTAVLADNITVDYQEGIPCVFNDQAIVVGIPETNPFSLAGDSGSFVVSEESPHKVKGQLFAGGESEGVDITIVSPIRKIIDDFKLEL